MRRSLVLTLLTLALPTSAWAGDARVTAFYYPWYGIESIDGQYQHWSQRDHSPPDRIASAYFPARGVYSSSDQLVVSAQMGEIRSAGIDEIAVSWWGKGSQEDERLPLVVGAARSDGIAVAGHLEPYPGRTVSSTVADVAYLRSEFGITTFYVYGAFRLSIGDWAAAQPALQANGTTVFAQTVMVGAALRAGFDGVYTYDILSDKYARICSQARRVQLVCAPSVGPGYDARRASGDFRVKPRRHGATYDATWRAVLAAKADRITITSFNEWHEGTQIEPAAPPEQRGGYRYLSYDGAWGLHGAAASSAYLARTLYWSRVFRNTLTPRAGTPAS